MRQPKYIIVDGSSYLYRAHYGAPAVVNSKGFPTGAIGGMVKMLGKLLRTFPQEHLLMVFDVKTKETWRHRLYPEYKANRKEMPLPLQRQVDTILEIIDEAGIRTLHSQGVEADDIIGTVVKIILAEGESVVISTGDKDFAQLVDPEGRVKLINTMTDVILDYDGVVGKYGVTPEQFVDWLTIVGDSTDNIPGFPGVGVKGASRLLQKYGSIDALIADAESQGEKLREHLLNKTEEIQLMQKLVTINTDVMELPIAASNFFKRSEPNHAALKKLAETLELFWWNGEL